MPAVELLPYFVTVANGPVDVPTVQVSPSPYGSLILETSPWRLCPFPCCLERSSWSLPCCTEPLPVQTAVSRLCHRAPCSWPAIAELEPCVPKPFPSPALRTVPRMATRRCCARGLRTPSSSTATTSRPRCATCGERCGGGGRRLGALSRPALPCRAPLLASAPPMTATWPSQHPRTAPPLTILKVLFSPRRAVPAPVPIPARRPRLAGTMFQKDLGSLLDKSSRVEQLVPALGAAAGLEGERQAARGLPCYARGVAPLPPYQPLLPTRSAAGPQGAPEGGRTCPSVSLSVSSATCRPRAGHVQATWCIPPPQTALPAPPPTCDRPPPRPAADAVPVAAQAAHLCKADLATSMVTEMTALAGTMGRHYALKEGLPAGAACSVHSVHGVHTCCIMPRCDVRARLLRPANDCG